MENALSLTPWNNPFESNDINLEILVQKFGTSNFLEEDQENQKVIESFYEPVIMLSFQHRYVVKDLIKNVIDELTKKLEVSSVNQAGGSQVKKKVLACPSSMW